MFSGPRPLQPIYKLVECRWKKDGYKSGVILTGCYDIRHPLIPCHSDMPACRVLLPLKPNAVMHE